MSGIYNNRYQTLVRENQGNFADHEAYDAKKEARENNLTDRFQDKTSELDQQLAQIQSKLKVPSTQSPEQELAQLDLLEQAIFDLSLEDQQLNYLEDAIETAGLEGAEADYSFQINQLKSELAHRRQGAQGRVEEAAAEAAIEAAEQAEEEKVSNREALQEAREQALEKKREKAASAIANSRGQLGKPKLHTAWKKDAENAKTVLFALSEAMLNQDWDTFTMKLQSIDQKDVDEVLSLVTHVLNEQVDPSYRKLIPHETLSEMASYLRGGNNPQKDRVKWDGRKVGHNGFHYADLLEQWASQNRLLAKQVEEHEKNSDQWTSFDLTYYGLKEEDAPKTSSDAGSEASEPAESDQEATPSRKSRSQDLDEDQDESVDTTSTTSGPRRTR